MLCSAMVWTGVPFPGVYCGCDGVTLKEADFDTCSLFLAREKMQYLFAIYIQIYLIPCQCLDDDQCRSSSITKNLGRLPFTK